MTASVLLTDGEQRSTLAAVRSLGRAGFRAIVMAGRRGSLAAASRHAAMTISAPGSLDDPAGFADAVAHAVKTHHVDVVLPMTDQAVLALLPLRDACAPAVIPFPPLEAFRTISDKAAVLGAAAEAGLAVPAQHVIRTPDECDGWHRIPLPVVLKPVRSVTDAGKGRVRVGISYAATRDELAGCLRSYPPSAFPVLAQSRVVGPGVGIFVLTWDDQVLATFAHRRLREKPPSGGVSVYRESIPADADLVERSLRLLRALGWWGIAMVEFKVDSATGRPHLMEINGRFWGSLQLALDAGVDFPRLLVEAALGRQPAPVRSYRAGVRSRWWWGDVDQLLSRLRHDGAELALPPGSPGRWRALAEFLVLWRPGDRNEVLRFDDPLPFIRESADWVRALIGRSR